MRPKICKRSTFLTISLGTLVNHYMLRLTKSAPTTFEPTGMLVTNVDVTYGGDTQSWASALVEEIKTGSYQFAAAGWISCSSTTQPWTVEDDVKKILNARQFPFQVTPLACPIVWAKESNAFDCSNVFKYITDTDLCTGAYFKTSIPIINEQIVKQGYRLAAWLNVIFDGSTGL